MNETLPGRYGDSDGGSKDKLTYLESLRAGAAIAVALSHFSNTSILTENALIRNANVMVDFFFVLSGFVIAYNYLDRIVDRPTAVDFQVKRFWRLYPLHLACLLAFLGLEAMQYFYEASVGGQGASPAFSRNTPSAFLSNAFLVHPLFDHDQTFNYPSWSIAAEFFTYMVFGLILLLPSSAHVSTWIALVLVSLVVLRAGGGIIQTRALAFPRCGYSFFLGVLTWWAIRSRPRDALPGYAAAPLLALSVVGICLPGQFPRWVLPGLFAGSLATLALERPTSPLKRLLTRPTLVYLGTISYGIYMIHAGVWEVMNITLRKIFHVPMSADGTKLALSSGAHTALLVLGMTLTVFGAHMSYTHIERRWRRR